MLRNVNVEKEDDLKTPAEYNPYYCNKVKKPRTSDLSFLKAICENTKE
jgi:hypothetical protein